MKAAIGAFISLIVLFGILGYLILPVITSPRPKKTAGREVAVTIEKDWSAGQIGEELAGKRIVDSAMYFRIYVKYKGLDGKLKPGEYVLKEGMTYEEVAEALRKGPRDKYITVTIPEGYTIEQEAEVLSKKLGINQDEFKSLAKGGKNQFLSEFEFLSTNKTDTLEGYLFPDTYRFKRGAKAEDVIRTQLAQFGRIIAGIDVAGSGRSIHELTTIGSLVEREARISEERPLISAVIRNRIDKNMLLQIDATVQYALPKWKKELTLKDLEVDSPYNTYKHPGLPPGPIAAPGLDCLMAAAKPANVDYLYYVVKDEQGHHFFTNDYKEFLKAKNKMPKK